MAERVQLQYQPITGPVWRAPVAESLAWLPSVQQPARALEYRRLGDFQQPPFQALYVPSGLQWQPQGKAPQVPIERRILGDFQQPPFSSLYQPSGLQWSPSDRYSGKPLPRGTLDGSIYPLQVIQAAYDPQNLEWIPSGKYPQIPIERRLLGDFQQPNFQALFKPELLQWQPSDRYAGKPLSYSLQCRFVVDPTPIATPYDPSFLMWLPMGASSPQIPLERRLLGDFQQPPFDTSSPPPTPAVPADQPSGGWPVFATLYERELSHRRDIKRRHQELERETQQIQNQLDRQIALELRKQERDAEHTAELVRLKALADQLEASEARFAYGERVVKALERATLAGNFSALEALDRELARANEEQEFLLIAATILLNEQD